MVRIHVMQCAYFNTNIPGSDCFDMLGTVIKRREHESQKIKTLKSVYSFKTLPLGDRIGIDRVSEQEKGLFIPSNRMPSSVRQT